MRKAISIVLVVLAASVGLSAQSPAKAPTQKAAPAASQSIAADQAPDQRMAADQQPGPDQPPKRAKTLVSGVLAFAEEKPVIKSDDGKEVFLSMPRFYYYAYSDGLKEGSAIKATGYLLPAKEKDGRATLVAEEVVIGGKTYVIVGPDDQVEMARTLGGPQRGVAQAPAPIPAASGASRGLDGFGAGNDLPPPEPRDDSRGFRH
jgi:hypothetical protein